MRDSEVVASIVAGDPRGLTVAYDRYADPLYKYCRSMLSPAGAAHAVQDTFVIAASRLDWLRDAQHLRAWLYAVARTECLRVQRADRTTAALAEAPRVTAGGGHAGDDAEHADLRTLLDDAAAGLDPADREVLELHLRQGLEAGEIAAVLGVSRSRVQSLLSRARDQLLACVGVLLVGRAGHDECRELAGLLARWDGRLTAPLRGRVHRHIEHCPTCTARRAYELRPAVLFGLSPGAAVVAAAADSLQQAAGPPADLRAHTLALAVGRHPSAVAHRAAVLGRAGPFGRQGFPRRAHAPAGLPGAGGPGGWRSSARGRVIVVAIVTLAAVIAAVAVALGGGTGPGKAAGGRPALPASAAAVPGPGPGTNDPGTHGVPASPTPGHPASSGAAAPTEPASPTATSLASPSATSSATPAPKTPSPSPTRASPTHTPTPSQSPSASASPGTLQVSPSGGTLTVPPAGITITLVAQGGPVTWSIAVSGGIGHVGVQPSAGTLRAGATTTVSIQASHSSAGRQLTVSPGGAEFTIMIAGDSPLAGMVLAPAQVALPSGFSW